MNEQENVKIENEQVTTPVVEPTTAAPVAPTAPIVETLDGVTVVESEPIPEPETTVASQPVGTVILTDVPTTEAPAAPVTEAPAASTPAPEIIPAATTAPVTEAPVPETQPATEPAKEEKKKEKKEKVPKEKKPFNTLLIILLVVGLAIGVGAGILISNSMKKEDSGNSTPANDNATVEPPNSYRVLFRDYVFDIPSSYGVQVVNNRLIIHGDGTTYAVELIENSYTLISNNKDAIKAGYEKMYTVKNMDEKDLGSGNYLVFDIDYGTNARLFFKQNNPTTVFIGVITKSDESGIINDYDLSIIDQILSSATLSNDRANPGEENGEKDPKLDEVFYIFSGITLDENAVPEEPKQEVESTPTETDENVTPETPDNTTEQVFPEEKPVEENTTEQTPTENTATPTEENNNTTTEENTTPSNDSNSTENPGGEESTTPSEENQ